jgi:recombination associated protein RdgC
LEQYGARGDGKISADGAKSPRVPALKGSLTYSRLFVDGELPDDFRERFVKAIRLRAMKPLDPDEEAPERAGWCAVGDPFELDLRYENTFYNEYLNLGFRCDRWAIPGPLLRAKVREAEATYLVKKGRERLSRKEKTELKELTARKLRRQLSPTMRVIDVSWSLDEGIVRFFSQAAKPIGQMCELFQRTFGLSLVPDAPYTLAARLGLSAAQETAWQELEITSFEEGGAFA